MPDYDRVIDRAVSALGSMPEASLVRAWVNEYGERHTLRVLDRISLYRAKTGECITMDQVRIVLGVY